MAEELADAARAEDVAERRALEEGRLPNGDPDWEQLGDNTSEKLVEELSEELETETPDDPTPDEIEASEDTSLAEHVWLGNYSISMVEFARTVGAAFDPRLVVAHTNQSAVRRTTIVTGPTQSVENFTAFLKSEGERAFAELKVWQKETAADRRGLTDMQKFLKHREFLIGYGEKVAARLRETAESL